MLEPNEPGIRWLFHSGPYEWPKDLDVQSLKIIPFCSYDCTTGVTTYYGEGS